MAVTANKIGKNLEEIRLKIAEACRRSRRHDADRINIVAVTKSVKVDTIKNLIDAGVTELAESRAQPLIDRAEQVAGYLQRRRNALPSPVRWHMVGTLQRNKVRKVVPVVELIHSVDSLRLAEEINVRAERVDKTLDVFVQVNTTDEPQKTGCAVGAAAHLAELVSTLEHLCVVGLMTLGPTTGGAEAARPAFVRLRELFDEIRADKIGGSTFQHLSMGMSDDYEIAVEEGATVLRLGRALFRQ